MMIKALGHLMLKHGLTLLLMIEIVFYWWYTYVVATGKMEPSWFF